jgi:multidrug efflux pump
VVKEWAGKLAERLAKVKSVRNVYSDASATGAAAYVDIDRDTAARLSITASDIDDALYSAFGQRIVSTIFTETNQYRVILEAKPGLLTAPVVAGPAEPEDRRRLAHAAVGDLDHQGTDRPAAGDPRLAVPGHHDRLRHRAGRLAGQGGGRHPQAMKDIGMPVSVTHTFLGAAGAYENSLSPTSCG